jgi:hypothetical protein
MGEKESGLMGSGKPEFYYLSLQTSGDPGGRRDITSS